jgi:hypothetical protein
LIYHRSDAPEITFEVKVTSDGRHLVIGSYQRASDHAEIHVLSTDEPRAPLSLVTGFTFGWHFIDGRHGVLYFRTDADAPFGRILRMDISDGGTPTTIVPESARYDR